MHNQALMTKSIRYGLRAVLTYDEHPEHPMQPENRNALITFHRHQHLSSRPHPTDPLDFLRELLEPHHPEIGRLSEDEWNGMNSRDILQRFSYPGPIHALILHDGGSRGCRIRMPHDDHSGGGRQIGWAYREPGRTGNQTQDRTGEKDVDNGRDSAWEREDQRLTENIARLEQYLNGLVFRMHLEDNYRRTYCLPDIYSKPELDQKAGRITANHGYPEPEELDEALQELIEDPEDLQLALEARWKKQA